LSYIVLTMPRLPINYQNALIYKFVCKDLDVKECYVGSTTDFRKRKSGHKTDCNNVKSKRYYLNVYQFIRDNNGWDNWDMVLIEKYPCDDRLELHQRERYWFEELNASLNKNIPSRSQKEASKEWYEDNKEKIKIQKKEYRESNKDKIEIQKKEYRKTNKDKIAKLTQKKYNCECGGKYRHQNKSHHLKTNKHQKYIHSILV
jgi:hypothetical protein